MKVVGHRDASAPPLKDQAAMARTAALVRGTARLAPRGVYRFASFNEADAWMTEMLLRTHERPSRKTSSASATP